MPRSTSRIVEGVGTTQSTLAALAACIALLLAACSSAPCEEAASKLERCLERLDCRDADPMEIHKCTTAETEGAKAVDQFRSLPCTAQLLDKAEEVNACPIDQLPYCNCWSI